MNYEDVQNAIDHLINCNDVNCEICADLRTMLIEFTHERNETKLKFLIREQITIYDDYLLIALQQQQMLAAGHHFVLIKEMLKLVEDKNFTDSLSAYNTLKNFTKSLKENVTYTSDGQNIPLTEFMGDD